MLGRQFIKNADKLDQEETTQLHTTFWQFIERNVWVWAAANLSRIEISNLLVCGNFPAVIFVYMMGNAVIKDKKWITTLLHAVSPRPVCATGWCTADNHPLAAKWGTWWCAAHSQKNKQQKQTNPKITKTKQAASRCNYCRNLCDIQPLLRG